MDGLPELLITALVGESIIGTGQVQRWFECESESEKMCQESVWKSGGARNSAARRPDPSTREETQGAGPRQMGPRRLAKWAWSACLLVPCFAIIHFDLPREINGDPRRRGRAKKDRLANKLRKPQTGKEHNAHCMRQMG